MLAVRSGHTPMKALGATVEMLRRVNVPIAGIVLNESVTATDATYKAYERYYTAAQRLVGCGKFVKWPQAARAALNFGDLRHG